MTIEDDEVRVEPRGAVLWLTIDRPARRNAMTPAVLRRLAVALREAGQDPACRAVVLTGAGERAFCAGADLTPGTSFAFDPARPGNDYADLLRAAWHCNLPLLARVNGACLAGGMGFLGMCDLAVAADHATFGLPETRIGIFPMQMLGLLQGLVPRRKLREWAITGEPFDAAEALEAGLVNYVVPGAELDAKMAWLLDRLLDKSPTALKRGKHAMRTIETLGFEPSLAFLESQIVALAQTEDAAEGRRAFAERRKPVFQGR